MSTDPTAEHIDAVAVVRAIGREHRPARVDVVRDLVICACGVESSNYDGLEQHRAELIVAALAASLPAEVMLAALVDGGYCLVCGGMNGAHHAADDGLPCPEDPDAVLDEVAP